MDKPYLENLIRLSGKSIKIMPYMAYTYTLPALNQAIA